MSDVLRQVKEGLSELIQLAHEADNEVDKLSFLSQVFDEVWDKDKSLLSLVWFQLFDFQKDIFPTVRIWLIHTIQDVLTEDINFLYGGSIKCLASLCSDSEVSVARNGVLCATNIYSKALKHIIKEEKSDNTQQNIEMWKELNNLREVVIDYIKPTTQASLLCYSYQFAVNCCLLFSSSETTNLLKHDLSLIDKIESKNNKIIEVTIIKEYGTNIVEKLVNLIKMITNNITQTTVAISLVVSLSQIARLRTQFIPIILPSLLKFGSQLTIPNSTATTISTTNSVSVISALKSAFIIIVKSRFTHIVPYLDIILDYFTVHSVKDHLLPYLPRNWESYITNNNNNNNNNNSLKRVSDHSADGLSNKKIKEEHITIASSSNNNNYNSNVSNSIPMLNINTTSSNIVELLLAANFTIDMIADLVIDCMSTLPNTVPVNGINNTSNIINNNIPLNTTITRDPRLMNTQQNTTTINEINANALPTNIQTNSVMGSITHSNAYVSGSTTTDSIIVPPISNTIDNNYNTPNFTDKMEVTYTNNEDNIMENNTNHDNNNIEKNIEEETISTNEHYYRQAVMRIINIEKAAETAGKGQIRRNVIARLVSQLPLEHPIVNTLYNHIIQNISIRKELALSWLTVEYLQEEENNLKLAQINNNINNDSNDSSFDIENKTRYYTLLLKFIDYLTKQEDNKDRTFTYFIVEIPILFEEIWQIIKNYCENSEKLTIGYTTLRDLIIFRSKYRDRSLQLLLQYTSHKDDLIRSPAIRLVSNRLYLPLSSDSLSLQIEQFAVQLLYSLLIDAPESIASTPASIDTTVTDGNNDTTNISTSTITSTSITEEEIKRRLFLYFSLTTKKHELLLGIIDVYVQGAPSVKKVIHNQCTGLIRTIGMNSQPLLNLITNIPKKGEPLLLHFLHILTENNKPTIALINTVRSAYQKLLDARLLVPILSGLEKDEILSTLPKLVSLQSNLLKNAILKLLNTPSISPSELLIAFHVIDTNIDKSLLKKIIEAIQICFEQKSVFTTQVLAVVLQQLIDMSPLPQLVMRTIIQTVTLYPKLIGFIMSMLSRLIIKQIWNDKRLWEGFVKCCKITLPHSLPILIQLPPPQLESSLQIEPSLRETLKQYVQSNQNVPNFIKTTLGL